MTPKEATSAEVDPEMPANIVDARTFTSARPPGKKPTISDAKLKIRLVIPQRFRQISKRAVLWPGGCSLTRPFCSTMITLTDFDQ